MQALAEWVMGSRKQAIIAAITAAFFPLLYWISAAIVALVSLRKGINYGTSILIWALLPALAWIYIGQDPTPLVVIVGSFILALILRKTQSWEHVLIISLPIGVITGLWLEVSLDTIINQIIEEIHKFFISSVSEYSESGVIFDKDRLRLLLLGGLASVHIAVMLLSLMLARSWQAKLYNKGGFQQEFHKLRLPIMHTSILIIGFFLIQQTAGQELLRWLPLLLLPWIFAGVAFIHGVVAKRNLGKPWLIAFYFAVFFMGPYMITLLVFIAVFDSFIDFRKRIPAAN